MKSNRRNLVAILLSLALVGLAFFFSWNPEPRYDGKKLSQWLDEFNYHYHMTDDSPAFVEFSAAIRQIGTEAAPFLLNWIRYQPAHTNIKARVAFWLGALPDRLVPQGIRDWTDEEKLRARAFRAVVAFQVLGTNALPSLPELRRLATNSPDAEVVERAVQAMYELGPPAIPTMLQIIANPKAEGRYAAMLPLGSLGTNAQPAVPFLVRCLEDPADDVAYGAAIILGRMRLDAPTSIPALIHALHSENPMVRAAAARSLAMFQPPATSAVPALLKGLMNTNTYVRGEVEDALRVIAPDVLTNAPPP